MKTARNAAKKAASPALPEAIYRIAALLHTMRCITQHEDRLCLLQNEIKRTQAVGPRLSKELHALLEELPSDDYTSDLEAVEAALSSTSPTKKATKRPAKKAPSKPPQPKKSTKRPA